MSLVPDLTAPMLERLDAFLQKTGTWPCVTLHNGEYIVAAEWGEEAEDSPMAAAAVYGMGLTLEAALDQALRDANC